MAGVRARLAPQRRSGQIGMPRCVGGEKRSWRRRLASMHRGGSHAKTPVDAGSQPRRGRGPRKRSCQAISATQSANLGSGSDREHGPSALSRSRRMQEMPVQAVYRARPTARNPPSWEGMSLSDSQTTPARSWLLHPFRLACREWQPECC
ncbi:hypothetical protein C8Q76DRAFT_393311 [Earliella scabrosa]|nr:hypothetical protein C8Q76DRAFT_393311 [Earliella scabrosa]